MTPTAKNKMYVSKTDFLKMDVLSTSGRVFVSFKL